MTQEEFFRTLNGLVLKNNVLISEHGYEELAADKIPVSDIVGSINSAIIVEYYPEYHKGPCVLLLQTDNLNKPIHVLWGIPIGAQTPAVVITAYRPDPMRWSPDFLRRKQP